jgi:hypothetical protein
MMLALLAGAIAWALAYASLGLLCNGNFSPREPKLVSP